MALNFPNRRQDGGPLQPGDQYTGNNGINYIFDGDKWVGHAPASSFGTNSIENNGHVVQVTPDGNLTIPVGAQIIDELGNPVHLSAASWQITTGSVALSLLADGTLSFPDNTIKTNSPNLEIQLGTTTDPYWITEYGGFGSNPQNAQAYGTGAVYDSKGNLYVIGAVGSDTTSYLISSLMLKYDPDGNLLWHKTWQDPINGGNCGADNVAIAIDANDRIYWVANDWIAGGMWTGYFDTDGNIGLGGTAQQALGINNLLPSDLACDNLGNYYISGLVNPGIPFIVKINGNSAAIEWTSDITPLASDSTTSTGVYRAITVNTSTGDVFAIGDYIDDGQWAMLSKWNADGVHQWTNKLVTIVGDIGEAVVFNNGYVYTIVNDLAEYKTVVSKFSTDGVLVWAADLTVGGGFGYDLSFDADYNVYITGIALDQLLLTKLNPTTGQVIYSRAVVTTGGSIIFDGTGDPLTGHRVGDIYQDKIAITAMTTADIIDGTTSTPKIIVAQLPIDGSIVGEFENVLVSDVTADVVASSSVVSYSVTPLDWPTDTIGTSISSLSQLSANAATIVGGHSSKTIGIGSGVRSTNWNFGADGTLAFPDGSVQSTAYVAGTADLGKFVFDSDGDSAFISTTDDAGASPDRYDIVLIPNGEGYASIRVPNYANTLAGDPVRITNDYENGSVAIETNTGTWTFSADGNLTIPGNIHKTTDVSIVVGSQPIENVEIFQADTTTDGVPELVWRMFVLSGIYPDLGDFVTSGTTVTTGWGTPVTATIQQVIKDIGAGYWVFIFNQDIVTGFSSGPKRATFNLGLQTWTFGTDGTLTIPATGDILRNGISAFTGGGGGASNGWELSSSTALLSLASNGTLTLSGDTPTINGVSTGTDVNIIASDGETTSTWVFGGDGKLTIPGSVDFGGQIAKLDGPQPNGTTDLLTLWNFNGGNPQGEYYNYAIGVEGNHVWFAQDTDPTTQDGGFKFYSRGVQAFKIAANGDLMFKDGSIQTTAWTGVNISTVAPTTTGTTGALWYDTVEGRLYTNIGTSWVDASPTIIPPPETYLDKIQIDGSTLTVSDYSWTFGEDGMFSGPNDILKVPGDIQDANGSVIRVATTSTAPTRVDGQLWYDSQEGRTYIKYNNQWVDSSPTVIPPPSTYLEDLTIDGDDLYDANGSVIRVAAEATAPTRVNGQLWFDTVEGRAYIKYNDQWVDLNPPVIPPPSTYLGDIEVDGSTLHINNSTLTIDATGTLLVNGATYIPSDTYEYKYQPVQYLSTASVVNTAYFVTEDNHDNDGFKNVLHTGKFIFSIEDQNGKSMHRLLDQMADRGLETILTVKDSRQEVAKFITGETSEYYETDNTPYRGFIVSIGRMWGSEPHKAKLVFSAEGYPNLNIDTTVSNDTFTVSSLTPYEGTVGMVVVYGTGTEPLSKIDLWEFAKSIIDNIIYGIFGINNPTDIRSAFYSNIDTIIGATLPKDSLYPHLEFYDGSNYLTIESVNSTVTSSTGTDAAFDIKFDTEHYFITTNNLRNLVGVNYQVGDTFLADGTLFGGTSIVNDCLITVTLVNNEGRPLDVSVTGTPNPAAVVWPIDNIEDGGDDQEDNGNYIYTNVSGFTYNGGYQGTGTIPYAGGEVSDGTNYFGAGSQYVVTYKSSVFGIWANGATITSIGTDGNSGFDGNGVARAENLSPATSYQVQALPINGSGYWSTNATYTISLDLNGYTGSQGFNNGVSRLDYYGDRLISNTELNIATKGPNNLYLYTGDSVGDSQSTLSILHNQGIQIDAHSNNSEFTWLFDNQGKLKLPGSYVGETKGHIDGDHRVVLSVSSSSYIYSNNGYQPTEVDVFSTPGVVYSGTATYGILYIAFDRDGNYFVGYSDLAAPPSYQLTGWVNGEQVFIPGTVFGGSSPANDCTATLSLHFYSNNQFDYYSSWTIQGKSPYQAKLFTFDYDGAITFPDGQVQTTAWNDASLANAIAGEIITNTATVGVGGLTVNGPVTFNGPFNYVSSATNVIISNSGTFYGDVNGVGALYAGVAGSTPLPATVIQSAANVDDYIQNNFQNLNSGNQASTEWVATADNGNDSNNYIDLGIAGGSWDGSQANSVGTAAQANDSWVYTQGNTSNATGGNLVLGTIKNGKSVKILAGSSGAGSIVASFSSTGLTLLSGAIKFADGSTQTTAASVFNTSTLVAQAVTAQSVVGGIGVSTIVAGTGTYVSTSTGAVTVWTGAASWTGGTVSGTATVATFIGTATASSTNTGALQVVGGLGVSGNVWANTLYSNDGLFRGPSGYGSLQLASGGALYVTGDLILNGTGLIKGPAGYLNITLNSGWSTAVRFTSTATVAGATDATSTTSGALIVSGGVGIAKNVYVGGVVYQPYLPAFRVTGTGAAIAATNTLTSINFVVDYNQGNYLNTSTGIFTAPFAGIYQVNLVARTYTNTGPSSQVIVYKNGSTVAIMIEWATNTTANHIGGSTAIKLAVGDTLKVVVALGTISFDGNDNWSVAFLG